MIVYMGTWKDSDLAGLETEAPNLSLTCAFHVSRLKQPSHHTPHLIFPCDTCEALIFSNKFELRSAK